MKAPTGQQSAAYIEQIAKELADLARQEGLSEALSYVLDMAVLEAADNKRALALQAA